MVSDFQTAIFKKFTLKHVAAIVFFGAIFFVLVFSVSTLTTKPRLWTDEAVSIDIARSFLTHGVLSPQIAPDTLYAFPHLIQSTGFPVTISLAVFFKLFGYGFYQARVFMLLWILAALGILFVLGRRLFGRRQALLALLLFISFASFYASGRTAVGEIPGFVFLLAGFFFLLEREQYFLTGIFWGLAVVAKPSVFGLIIPTVFFTLLLEREDWKRFLKRFCAVAVGMIPAGLGWIFFVIKEPFVPTTWRSLGTFYSNPYSSSIYDNMVRNLFGVVHSTTLIYFGLLFLVIVLARYAMKDVRLRFFYTFTIIYSVFAFLYYLRSPGWLRYILIAELLILFLLPYSCEWIASWVKERWSIFTFAPKRVAAVFVLMLVIIQFVQMFTVADIFSSNAGLPTARYVNERFPSKSVSLLNALDVSVSINTEKRYNTFELTGMPLFGTNTLLLQKPPDVIVSTPNDRFVREGQRVLDSLYVVDATVGGYTIYLKK